MKRRRKGRLDYYLRMRANCPPAFGLRRPVDWVYADFRRQRREHDQMTIEPWYWILDRLERVYGVIS